MALKPDGHICEIAEQIIEDPVSGLTLQFERVKGSTAPARLRIFGNLPFGNREWIFDVNGEEAGGGTFLGTPCRPNWLKEVKS